MTFKGALADINAALEGMGYTPNGGYTGADTLTITTDDLGNSGTGGPETDIDVVNITVNVAPVITSDGGGATASVNVAENTTTVTTVTATDADGDPLTFSLSGGTDQAFSARIRPSSVSTAAPAY
jgi:hypothetical protein